LKEQLYPIDTISDKECVSSSLGVPCAICKNIIEISNKRICEPCKKEKKKKQVNDWKQKHPEKNREYQILKRVRKNLREGKDFEIRTYTNNCVDCGTDITNRPSWTKYCKICGLKRKNFWEPKKLRRFSLGTGGLMGKPKRDKDGSIDFLAELKAISKEKRRIFTQGCKWLVEQRIDHSRRG
jgi:hypothetical protein